MSDKVDDLIQQMQHLEASTKAAGQARVGNLRADKLKTQAMKVAAAAQADLDVSQKKIEEGEAKLLKARTPGLPPLEAADLLTEGRALVTEHKPSVIKARAKLNFALDRMDEADRAAWEALQAEARAEAHAQLATELFPGSAASSPMPDGAPAGTGAAPAGTGPAAAHADPGAAPAGAPPGAMTAELASPPPLDPDPTSNR